MQSNTSASRQRIMSVDILRGIIMCLMALDHVRDFFSNATFDALDLSKTTPILFITRWITHLCAPTFIFLSGVSIWLSMQRKTKKEASLFLVKRGIWLLFLELTVIGFAWQLNFAFTTIFAQVIWVIAWSMLVMAGLIFLKPAYVGIIGLILIFGHNLFDHVQAQSFGKLQFLWLFLHQQGYYQINSYKGIIILYPLVPWVGVMAAGYAFGTLFKLEPQKRDSLFIKIGLASLILFFLLRYINIYGDPFPRQPQSIWWKSILEFIKVQKYPPSLLYVLLMLGISILALAFLDRVNNWLTRVFTVFGKVPFFYYILHVYLIHLLQAGVAVALGYNVKTIINPFNNSRGNWGFNLLQVYLIWLGVLVVLYFPCKWFVKVKQQRSHWWLSYL